jgi:hypothetical protein
VAQGDQALTSQVFGALTLYLNFVNLFHVPDFNYSSQTNGVLKVSVRFAG